MNEAERILQEMQDGAGKVLVRLRDLEAQNAILRSMLDDCCEEICIICRAGSDGKSCVGCKWSNIKFGGS